MEKCCAKCKFYHKQTIGDICRLSWKDVKPTDCCDRIEEKEDNFGVIKYITTMILILVGINSVFSSFILQKEVSKYTDNFWIIFGVGFVFLCPIINLILRAIRKLNEEIK